MTTIDPSYDDSPLQIIPDIAAHISHQTLASAARLRTILYLLETPEQNPQGHNQAAAVPAELLQLLSNEIERLRRLGQEALHLSLAASAEIPLDIEPVNLVQLLKETTATFRLQAPERRLKERYEANLPPIQADPARLRDVLDNLISNALKYSAPPSPIILRTERKGDSIRVGVTSFGPIISTADQEKIFTKFYRGSAHTQQPGHGLGLYLARRLIELHGGYIWVESTPAKGTTFYFSLPLTSLGLTPSELEQPPQKLRILVVEDDLLVAIGLKLQLTHLGHQVIDIAVRGDEAVRQAEAQQPDLILMDINLPGLNGLQATEAIMARTPAPIILMSGYPREEMSQAASQAGSLAYLTKPVMERELQAAIQAVYSRFQQLRGYQPGPQEQNGQEDSAQPGRPPLLQAFLEQHEDTCRHVLFFFRDRGGAWWQESDIINGLKAKPELTGQALDQLTEAGYLQRMVVLEHIFYNLADQPEQRQEIEQFFQWSRHRGEKLKGLLEEIGQRGLIRPAYSSY